MQKNTKNFLISHNYYAEVRLDDNHSNVVYCSFPANLLKKIPAVTYQYYFEDDNLICTNLNTKKQGNIEVNRLTRRTILLCDILIKAVYRELNLELVVALKNNKNTKLINLLEQDDTNKTEEKKISDMLTDILRQQIDDREAKKRGLFEIYTKFQDLIQQKGLVS